MEVERVLGETERDHAKAGRFDACGESRRSGRRLNLVPHVPQQAHERQMEVVQVAVHRRHKQDVWTISHGPTMAERSSLSSLRGPSDTSGSLSAQATHGPSTPARATGAMA